VTLSLDVRGFQLIIQTQRSQIRYFLFTEA